MYLGTVEFLCGRVRQDARGPSVLFTLQGTTWYSHRQESSVFVATAIKIRNHARFFIAVMTSCYAAPERLFN